MNLPLVPKSRVVISLLLLFMLAPQICTRPADAPLPRLRVESAQESVGNSLPVVRPLSRREIFQAIQNDLARMGISERGELQPGDLRIQSSVPALRDDMGLQVKRVGFDPIRRETVFELWTSHAPQYLPFEVTTRRNPQSFGLAPRPEWKLGDADGVLRKGNPAIGKEVNRATSKLPVLAKPGRSATLVMLGENVRITTSVVPLQPGTKGQCILVRDLATARVMTAEVVDEGLLRTSF